jgi:hypothetical protein
MNAERESAEACVPWEKLSLATFISALIKASRICGVSLAGPAVQTIFIFLCNSSTLGFFPNPLQQTGNLSSQEEDG